MKPVKINLAALTFLSLAFSGCMNRSYHPWLEDAFLVGDDRLAGVWLAVDGTGQDDAGEDIFLIRSIKEIPSNEPQKETEAVPPGYYGVTWIENDKLRETATPKNIFISPHRVFGAMFRLHGQLFIQVWGNTVEESVLVAPMHLIFKARLEDQHLYLHDLVLENLDMQQLSAEGLMLEAKKDEPKIFFSPTDKLTAFILDHQDEEGFFSDEPMFILKRIRDLRGDVTGDEDLVPVP